MSTEPTNHERDMRAAAALGVAISSADTALQQGLKIAATIEDRNPDAGFTIAFTDIRAQLYHIRESLERFVE